MNEEELIRVKILNGATQLFQRFGLKKTTMNEIAASVGMGKSSLYYYFKSKEDVFDSVVNDELQKLRSSVDKAVKQKTELSDMLITYANTYFEELVPRQTLYRIVNKEDNEAGSMTRLKMIIDFEIDYLAKLLIEHSTESQKQSFSSENEIKSFAETIVCSIYGLIHYSFVINSNADKKKFNTMISTLMNRIL